MHLYLYSSSNKQLNSHPFSHCWSTFEGLIFYEIIRVSCSCSNCSHFSHFLQWTIDLFRFRIGESDDFLLSLKLPNLLLYFSTVLVMFLFACYPVEWQCRPVSMVPFLWPLWSQKRKIASYDKCSIFTTIMVTKVETFHSGVQNDPCTLSYTLK